MIGMISPGNLRRPGPSAAHSGHYGTDDKRDNKCRYPGYQRERNQRQRRERGVDQQVARIVGHHYAVIIALNEPPNSRATREATRLRQRLPLA
jgi:hypothetical protein